MRFWKGNGCIAVLALLGLAASASAGVTVDSWSLESKIKEGDLVDQALTTSVTMPFDYSQTVTAGGVSSTDSFLFSTSEDGGDFYFGFDHDRETGYARFLGEPAMLFSVDRYSPYTLEGMYAQDGTGTIAFSVFLTDLTTGIELASNLKIGTQPDATLMLTDGLAGNLIPGHDYELGIMAQTSRGAGGTDTTASGYVHFIVTPEPVSLCVLAVGALVGLRRRIG